jgi:hypothetical protein
LEIPADVFWEKNMNRGGEKEGKSKRKIKKRERKRKKGERK